MKPLKTASLRYEHKWYADGYRAVVGIDEAGRGSWAGPVTAGAVCLPEPSDQLAATLTGIRDSKQMTALQREKSVEVITETALAWGIGSASSYEIDLLGIVPATKLAMSRALYAMMNAKSDFAPDVILLDTMSWKECPLSCERERIKKGDQNSLSIAAASVLAKTWRDAYMRELATVYPDYGFDSHKGYGTAKHRQAILDFSATPTHRMTFRPLQVLSS